MLSVRTTISKRSTLLFLTSIVYVILVLVSSSTCVGKTLFVMLRGVGTNVISSEYPAFEVFEVMTILKSKLELVNSNASGSSVSVPAEGQE